MIAVAFLIAASFAYLIGDQRSAIAGDCQRPAPTFDFLAADGLRSDLSHALQNGEQS